MQKLILIVLLQLIFIFIGPISNFVGINLIALKNKYPGLPLLLNGIFLIIYGIIIIAFRNEFGKWSAIFRKKLADKFPAWKKMSGLPKDKVEYYLSVEFNSKMVIVAGLTYSPA